MKIIKICFLYTLMVPGCSALYAYGDAIKISHPEVGPELRGLSNDDQINQEEQQREEQLRAERELNLKTDFYDPRDINAQALREVPPFQEGDSDQDGNLIDSSTVELSRNQAVRELELQAIERSCTDMKFTRKKSVDGLAGKKAEGFAHKTVVAVNTEIELISSEVIRSKELINQNKENRIKVKLLMDWATTLGQEIDNLLTEGATRKDVFGRRLEKDMNTIDKKLKELAKVNRELYSIVRELEMARDRAEQEKELIDRQIRLLSDDARAGYDNGKIGKFIEDNRGKLTAEEITELTNLSAESSDVKARKEELNKQSRDKIGEIYKQAQGSEMDPAAVT